MIAIAAIPPTTPPTIAPTFDDPPFLLPLSMEQMSQPVELILKEIYLTRWMNLW